MRILKPRKPRGFIFFGKLLTMWSTSIILIVSIDHVVNKEMRIDFKMKREVLKYVL